MYLNTYKFILLTLGLIVLGQKIYGQEHMSVMSKQIVIPGPFSGDPELDIAEAFNLDMCRDRSRNNHVVGAEWIPISDDYAKKKPIWKKYRVIRPECAPDTLYSWGNEKKLNWFREHLSNNASEWKKMTRDASLYYFDPKFKQALFASRNPIDSFGYGAWPIRIKLKKNIKILFAEETALSMEKRGYSLDYSILTNKCELGPSFQTDIIARYWESSSFIGTGEHIDKTYSGMEFILCDASPIHSWSHGTHEHYNEAYRELQWISKHSSQYFDTWLHQDGLVTLFQYNVDGGSFSSANLERTMIQFYQSITNENEEIFFSPDLPENEKNREIHFSTDHPTVFNAK